MPNSQMGRLEKVDLREGWSSEANDFTPWLAQEENLKLLGDTIGIELELEAQEKNVGPFRADILCKDTATNNWVLIENQLARTDHIHLGQLLTYAAGLDAVTIVWVAANFTDEHRATLDWLNEITEDRFNFFGLEIELWRIEGSPPAPKFNIASEPNDWSRAISKAITRGLTETQIKQLEYWTALKAHLEANESEVSMSKPQAANWMGFGIGRTSFALFATVNSIKQKLGVEVYMYEANAKTFFHLLYRQKREIESEMGTGLDWQELPGKKTCKIALCKSNTDPLKEEDWPDQHEWFRQTLEKFDQVFRHRIKKLNPADLS